MEWLTDMRCKNCQYVDEGRGLPDLSRQEALIATLACPNCDTQDGLEVINRTLTNRGFGHYPFLVI
jgi:hypothetical protein